MWCMQLSPELPQEDRPSGVGASSVTVSSGRRRKKARTEFSEIEKMYGDVCRESRMEINDVQLRLGCSQALDAQITSLTISTPNYIINCLHIYYLIIHFSTFCYSIYFVKIAYMHG